MWPAGFAAGVALLAVGFVLAVPAAVAAFALLVNQRPEGKARLDLLGTVVVSVGLLGIVYGCSKAESDGWTAPITLGLLIGGLVLVALFVLIETRVANPLLPMRVVLDRGRAGAYMGLGLACVGLFGVFLFLTFYLQTILMYSPIKTGFAFLPMVGAIMVMAREGKSWAEEGESCAISADKETANRNFSIPGLR